MIMMGDIIITITNATTFYTGKESMDPVDNQEAKVFKRHKVIIERGY